MIDLHCLPTTPRPKLGDAAATQRWGPQYGGAASAVSFGQDGTTHMEFSE